MKRIISALIVSIALILLPTALADVLNLPPSLNIIEEEAFYGDMSLDKVVLGENVTTIGPRAFSNSGLKEVTLTRAITSISDDAFEGCGQFKINAPIGSYAYNWCIEHGYIGKPEDTPAEYFTYETINGLYARITGYIGQDTIVVIPEEIDDYIIQKISNNTFKNNKTIEYVFVPDTVIEIGASAFYGCTALTGVNLGKSVTTIGSEAFRECPNLLGVNFPDSLTTTGNGIFRNCLNLEYFDYPLNWSKAGEYTIAGCPKIVELSIPKGITIVPEYAFRYCDNLTSIKISDTVEKIGQYSFGNCKGITKLTIPENVVELNGFQNCSNLCNVELSAGLKFLGNGVFSGCTALNNIELPEGLTEIGNNAFNGCTGLNEIRFPEGLIKIGLYSFRGCNVLKNVTLPDSVREIGSSTFENCTNLSSFHYPKNLNTITRVRPTIDTDNGYVFKGCKSLKTISVPEGVSDIPTFAFRGADYLRNITLPSTLTSIGMCSFMDCTSIRKIDFPDAITTVGLRAFKGCTYLEEAILPDSVTEIGSSAFENCTNLASFHYPRNLNTITRVRPTIDTDNGYVFKGCKSLKTISVPEGVSDIPTFAFRGADYLTNITLPSTLTGIGMCSFMDCTSIRKIDFPDAISTVGIRAFKGCTYLEEAILPDSVTEIGSSAFENCTNLASFHYPKNLNTITRVRPTIDTDNGYVFKGCESLKTISVPEGVVEIPMYAFRSADSLTNIILPSTLNKIGYLSFEGCLSLEKVYLGYNVTSIGKKAFENCPVLTIWTEYGATGLQYAIDNKIAYYYLSPDEANIPSGTLYLGEGFPIHGYARSSINLTNVTATIWNQSGSTVLQQVSVNPNQTDYSLASTVNGGLLLATLPVGSYRFSLSAATELSEELWFSNSFTIVPPPLRIYIEGLTMPTSMVDSMANVRIGGRIVSNYAITALSINVYDANTGGTARTLSLQPGSYEYDLSNASGALAFEALGDSAYTIRITAVANGETRALVDTEFQSVNANTCVLTDELSQRLMNFVQDKNNRNVFSTEYAKAVVSDQTWVEKGISLLDSYLSKSIFDWIEDGIIRGGQKKDLIDLYKQEIVSLVDMGAYDQANYLSGIESETSMFLGVLETTGTIKKTNFHSEDGKALAETFTDIIDFIGDVISDLSELESSYETIASICANIDQGLLVLDYIGESASVASKAEFDTALKQLKREYVSAANAAIYEVGQYIVNRIRDVGQKAVKDFSEELLKKVGYSINNGLDKIIGKCLWKATGLDEAASNLKKFFVQYDLLQVSLNSYYGAFDAVKGGDHSDDALKRLCVAINTTRNVWLRVTGTISSMPQYAYTIGNEALHYQNSQMFRNTENFA